MKFYKFPATVVVLAVAAGILVNYDRDKSRPDPSASALPASTPARYLDQDLAAGGNQQSRPRQLQGPGKDDPDSQGRNVIDDLQLQLALMQVQNQALKTRLARFQDAERATDVTAIQDQLAQLAPPPGKLQSLNALSTPGGFTQSKQWNRVMSRYEAATGIPQHEIEALMKQ